MAKTLTLASILILGARCLLSGAVPADEACMLQTNRTVVRREDQNTTPSNSRLSCAPLTHHGAYATVDVAVGTPSQVFSLVADTGSNHVIVSSCACQELRKCPDRCFTGTGHSSTFRVKGGPTGPPSDVIKFGSGPINVAVASDLVRVGEVAKDMEDSVLLMVDQHLDFPTATFEGILGLGLPMSARRPEEPHMFSTSALFAYRTSDVDKIAEDPLRLAELKSQSKGISKHNVVGGITGELGGQDDTYRKIGFMESAGVSRFSMCFNDGAVGALRLNPPAAEKTLGNVGRNHWAVDFRGVSIGTSAERVGFCAGEGMKAGQETHCAAIPDSGMTAITAPKDHIDSLFESLCDGWDRCLNNHTAMIKSSPSAITVPSKIETFRSLLSNCAAWMDDATGLDELPPIHFGLRGSDGSEQEIQLPGWAYVTATQRASGSQFCEPAFSAMEFVTDKNGPIWVLGTPFFLTHEVGFDMRSSPPGISFTSLEDSPCGSCATGDGAVALVSGSVRTGSSSEGRHRRPRVLDGPRRQTSIDPSKPL